MQVFIRTIEFNHSIKVSVDRIPSIESMRLFYLMVIFLYFPLYRYAGA